MQIYAGPPSSLIINMEILLSGLLNLTISMEVLVLQVTR